MSRVWTYYQNQELPAWAGRWLNGAGEPIDLSTGYSFTAKLVNISTSGVALTKTNDITGGDGSAPLTDDPDELPGANVVVAWSAGELNLAPATYRLHITASSAAGDRVLPDPSTIIIKAAV